MGHREVEMVSRLCSALGAGLKGRGPCGIEVEPGFCWQSRAFWPWAASFSSPAHMEGFVGQAKEISGREMKARSNSAFWKGAGKGPREEKLEDHVGGSVVVPARTGDGLGQVENITRRSANRTWRSIGQEC